jgi:DNA-binding IscR family transcriptional regulator
VEECGIRPIWSIVNRFLADALDGVTIADLIESELLARTRLKASIQEQALRL